MEHMRPAVEDFWKACEKIHILILSRQQPLSLEEKEFIKMTCDDLLSNLQKTDSSTSTNG